MTETTFIWQCECGHVDHTELPEDCPKCLSVGKFTRVPEDQLEEVQAEAVLSSQINEEDEEEEDLHED
jgi:hypothetical protein